MDFKLPFVFFPICASMLLFVKWRRSGTAFAGNEQILHPLVFSLVLIFPGSVQVCTVRVAVYSLLFSGYVFWNTILKRGRDLSIPVTVYAAAVILLYEILCAVLGYSYSRRIDGYCFVLVLLWFAFCGYAYWFAGRGLGLRSTVGIPKLLQQVAVAALFALLSGAVMVVLLFFPSLRFLPFLFLSLFMVLHLWYLKFDKPQCMQIRHLDEVLPLKRRGYSSGRLYAEGQILEDEGGGVADEGVVEDSRIIYALMTLFEREKLYLNVDIKIASVALMIGTNKTYLSRALNTRLFKNFCQFVNYYRVREVCELFIENPDVEMKELAEQCGFNSSSNFSIVFKYNTGFSPGDWCRVIKTKLDNEEVVSVDDFLL